MRMTRQEAEDHQRRHGFALPDEPRLATARERQGAASVPEGAAGGLTATKPAAGRTAPATVFFVIHGAPVGKPRQTQRDKWAKRPCVMRYRAWTDKARAAAPANLTTQPLSVSWVAYLPFPQSWRQPLRDALRGGFHRHKPDRDNIDKAILDALFKQDCCVAIGSLEKRWDDGQGARIEVTVTSL